jgi:hypothetical protein
MGTTYYYLGSFKGIDLIFKFTQMTSVSTFSSCYIDHSKCYLEYALMKFFDNSCLTSLIFILESDKKRIMYKDFIMLK